MNYLLYNFQLILESELQLPISNRAFQYNDGAFETMLFTNGKISFLEDHLERLHRAAKILRIELPILLSEPEMIAFWVKKLIAENQYTGNTRIKIKIWRSGAGLYTPTENSAECLISVSPQKESSVEIGSADLAQTARTHFTPYSFFKGPNSLQYVLAGIEKKQRNLDEIILMSSEGFVSECLASNIFWIKNDTVFTPEIETGCIAGVMRENLLRLFQAENIAFREGKYLPEDLLQAETIFTTNAMGINIIRRIGVVEFTENLPDWLKEVADPLLE